MVQVAFHALAIAEDPTPRRRKLCCVRHPQVIMCSHDTRAINLCTYKHHPHSKLCANFVLSQVVIYLQKCDETLSTIKYPKRPKKGGKQGTKWKDPHPRKQMNHLRRQTTRGTSSSLTPSCCKKGIK